MAVAAVAVAVAVAAAVSEAVAEGAAQERSLGLAVWPRLLRLWERLLVASPASLHHRQPLLVVAL